MKYFLILGLVFGFQQSFAQGKVSAQMTDSCETQKQEKLTFLSDGSFQDPSAVQREMSKLKPCGLDDYDIQFFGKIDVLSSMLKKLTESKDISMVTYGDMLAAIERVKKSPNYQQLKKLALISQKLAATRANIRTWEQDRLLFLELGSSEKVMTKVYEYLRQNPDNTLTYQALLMELKEK
ncbi:hypothetical protein [Nonlabens ponticola]|uniref:DUF4476 domain-containing protein n=1 Tax=Nonlabens ponticola TaxID=2496866 RepID=A0A3S9MV60_9FLAO|nr:hypothetical protein [Nonlabens ponticola]AZQ43058.1 hypothetical protein EJ995_01975 [Nonlabens ponticola]